MQADLEAGPLYAESLGKPPKQRPDRVREYIEEHL
jgi:hypothetical protein